jgi:hypothetical protein
LVDGAPLLIVEANALTKFSQGRAHAQALGRPGRSFENISDFGLGATAMMGCANTKRAMYLIGQIPDGDRCHDGSIEFLTSMILFYVARCHRTIKPLGQSHDHGAAVIKGFVGANHIRPKRERCR